jgi:MFS family permease
VTGHAAEAVLVRRLVLAEAVTLAGDAVTLVALPLTAVVVLHASPAELALVGFAQALPILIVSIPLGAWVDRRMRRWPLLLVGDLTRAALLATVPIFAALGVLSLPLLTVIAFLLSCAGTLFDLSFAGWVPRLLNGDALHLANARIELSRSGALVAGPALAGGLVAAFSAPFALLADALSFVASALIIGSTRRAEPVFDQDAAPRRIRDELTAGASFLRGQPLVAAVVATATINNLSRNVAMAIAILYLIDSGGLDPAAVGIAFGLGNSGFLAGAIIARRASARLGMGPTMRLGVSLFGPSMLLFALVPASLAGPTFTLMLFAHGFGIAIHNVNQVTVRQVLTPDHLRARVTSVTRLSAFGAIPVGTLAGGVIAEIAGIRAALVVSGLGLLAGSLPYALVRVGRLRSIADFVSASRPAAAADEDDAPRAADDTAAASAGTTG